MAYHDHAWTFKPQPVKPVRYTTHRTLLDRLRPVLLVLLVVAVVTGMASDTAAVIARMHAVDAQLEAAHLQGRALGQAMCKGGT